MGTSEKTWGTPKLLLLTLNLEGPGHFGAAIRFLLFSHSGFSGPLGFPFFFNVKNFLNYFWLHWIFVAFVPAFSSCSEWGLLLLVVCGLLIEVASLVLEQGSRHVGFSSCST